MRLSGFALTKKLLLFGIMNRPAWVAVLGQLATTGLRWRLPVQGLIRKTVFEQFCGGETLEASIPVVQELAGRRIGSIPDYSVEGQASEHNMDQTLEHLLQGLRFTARQTLHPLFVFKVSGLVDSVLLARMQSDAAPGSSETEALERGRQRVMSLMKEASDLGCPVMVDAEESWIQGTVDQWVLEGMRGYNKTKPLVVHTLQMYRHDRLAYLHEILQQSDREGFIPAFKVVRGAYMEKERARALEYGTTDPIQPDKASTDRDFDLAVQSILCHPKAFLCLGTHNRNSCVRATEWMEKVALPVDSTRVLFAQLLGMSDSLTEELARAGYPVSKYLPYGPVAEVLPYLLRRARENSSASGEISREFAHLLSEKRRRQEKQPR